MADETITIRVGKDVQERFHALAEGSDFKNKGEFFSSLLTQYQLELAKDETALLGPAIAAVEELTDRIKRIMIGAGEQLLSHEEKQRGDLLKVQAEFEKHRALLQEKIEARDAENRRLQAQNQELRGQAESAGQTAAELRRQLAETEKDGNYKLALVDEYKDKNSRLVSMLNEQQSEIREAQALAAENRNLKYQMSALQQKLDQEKIKTDMEKQQALIALRQELNDKMDEQQAKYSESLHSYEAMVKDLLSRLELRAPANRQRQAKNKSPGAGTLTGGPDAGQ